MGLLRLLLALWVVLVHGDLVVAGHKFEWAWVAVQCFFIISGFYMSLILNEKYLGPGSAKLFYTNRLLRLIPTYWVVLLGTGLASLALWKLTGVATEAIAQYQAQSGVLGWKNLPYLLFSNLFVVGQNETLYLGFNAENGGLFWTADFYSHKPWVWRFLLIPQAWSLELELMFYALAPWIVRRRLPVVLGVMAASFAIRAAIYAKGYTFDPWTYRFFPSELALFLCGTVAYRIYRSPWLLRLDGTLLVKTATGALFAGVTLFQFLPIRGQFKAWPLYLLATAVIPWLFHRSKRSRWDRFIGELSYPVYISHYFIVDALRALLPASWQNATGPLAAVAAVLVSIALMRWIIEPLETFRQKRTASLPKAA